MKDVRLEFVDWARDGRYQLTLEDNNVWLHMKGRAGALETRSQFLCYPCEVALCDHITGLCSDLQFVFADTNSQIVTLPRAKKTGLAPRLKLIQWLRNALPVSRAFLWVGTQRRSARVC